MLYLCKIGSNPPTGVHIRKCHANSNKILTKNNMLSSFPSVAGQYLLSNKTGIIRVHIMTKRGVIEKSSQKITVWHHKACRVITNCDQERQIFLPAPNTAMIDYYR